MSWLSDLRLINLFSFYLTLLFLIGCALRWHQYRAFLSLVRHFPRRWPNLLKLVKQHGNLFLTWGTVMPLLLVLGLLLANTLAARLVWPQANDFKAGDLLDLWPAWPVLVVTGGAMFGMDAYGTWAVGELNKEELEPYFDQAEFWLRSWKAPVVSIFTLGYVNPRQMVAAEVRSSLESASQIINDALWWMVMQTGLRIAFGLSLWGTYALQDAVRSLAGS
jgi:hypothetical protein